MTPSGTRGMLNDALSIYFADATLASAFVARWCAGYSVETVGGVFQVREDATGSSHAAPNTVMSGPIASTCLLLTHRFRRLPNGQTAADSGAFRPASGHIETKTPSDLQPRDRESLYLTDRAPTHQEPN
jgi:hypothetical protein